MFSSPYPGSFIIMDPSEVTSYCIKEIQKCFTRKRVKLYAVSFFQTNFMLLTQQFMKLFLLNVTRLISIESQPKKIVVVVVVVIGVVVVVVHLVVVVIPVVDPRNLSLKFG